jgi:hypothetical protein
MSDALDITDYEEKRYAPPCTFDGTVQEVKHGNSQAGVPYTVIVLAVNEVLDQKLPRPDVCEDQDEIEAGDILTIYSRRDFNSDKRSVAEAMATMVGAKLGRAVGTKALKAPQDSNGDPDFSQAKDPEAAQTYHASFNVMKGDKVKVNNEDFFEGTRVIADVYSKTNKDGSPKKFTGFSLSLPADA